MDVTRLDQLKEFKELVNAHTNVVIRLALRFEKNLDRDCAQRSLENQIKYSYDFFLNTLKEIQNP